MASFNSTFEYKQFTATTQVRASEMGGIFCSSSTAGTVTIYDDAFGGVTNKIVDTVTLAPGWYFMPFRAQSGSFNVVVTGALSATIALA